MKTISADAAVGKIRDGETMVVPGGCANPVGFYQAFCRNVDRFKDLKIYSGLSLGGYEFLERGLGSNFRYLTWQAGSALRKIMQQNGEDKIGFIPLRLGELVKVVGGRNAIKIDTVLIQTSYPQNDGTVSLGVSVGATPHFLSQAKQVIAEFNSNMPVTGGDSKVAINKIDFALESDLPLATYDTGECDHAEAKIVDYVLSLIPEGATVQLGIGSVPDKVLSKLDEIGDSELYSGMLSSGLKNYLEKTKNSKKVFTGELAGNTGLYDYVHENPRICMRGIDKTHDVRSLAEISKFVSINSTIEIDLHGQCNGETVNGVQFSGVGGSLDYIEAAAMSEGGVSIMALPSTTRDATKSRIVKAIDSPNVVTTPRYCVDYVVTEYGITRLKGKTLAERSRALTEIAHPKFRDFLSSGD